MFVGSFPLSKWYHCYNPNLLTVKGSITFREESSNVLMLPISNTLIPTRGNTSNSYAHSPHPNSGSVIHLLPHHFLLVIYVLPTLHFMMSYLWILLCMMYPRSLDILNGIILCMLVIEILTLLYLILSHIMLNTRVFTI